MDKPPVASRVEDDEENAPLIPRTVLDDASQRVFVLSFFVLIQAWKIYDLVLLKSTGVNLGDAPSDDGQLTSLSKFTFVVKYAVLDGLMLWLLPVLNIPQLNFGAVQTLAMTVAMNAVTFVMMSFVTAPAIWSVVAPIWRMVCQKKELNILGHSVDLRSVIDMDAYFKGKVTIHYLPDSSARFNPFHFERTCLEQGELFYMPIEFNTTTDLGLLQLQHWTPQNEVTLMNYTGRSLRKLLRTDTTHLTKHPEYKRDSRISYVEVPLRDPGLYKIHRVADVNNNNIRTYKSEFMILTCPSAKFSYPPHYSRKYKCLNSRDALELPLVEYHGVAPATVRFATLMNGKPLRTFNATWKQEPTKPHADANNLRNLAWLQPQSGVRNLLEQELAREPALLQGVTKGELQFQLAAVVDQLGNTKRYNPASRDSDIWFEYEMKVPNKISIQGDARELLEGGHKRLEIRGTFADSDFPVSVRIEHEGAHNTTTFERSFANRHELAAGIVVTEPGVYRMVAAQDLFCLCTVETQEVRVALALPPLVNITANPIEDKCLGTTGYTFTLELAGKAPFYVQYRVYRKQTNGALAAVPNERGRTARYLKADAHTHTFKFSPQAEGNYVVVFTELKDRNYHEQPVRLDEARFTYLTYFKLASRASFFEDGAKRRVITTCYGEAAAIPVYFSGNGPFSFKYDFVDVNTGRKLVGTSAVADVHEYVIDPPAELAGRLYKVQLSEVKDKFACNAIVDSRESVEVQSRTDIPEIMLGGSARYTIVEGDRVEVPLLLKSSTGRTARDVIEYTVEHNGSVETHKVRGDALKIIATKAGTYSLASFSNNGCAGTVRSDQKVEVAYYPRPTLRVTSENVMKQHTDGDGLHLYSVCQGCRNPVTLHLEGAAPFVVDYEMGLPNGRVERKSMSVESNTLEILLPTNDAGAYEHHFVAVYDRRYTRAQSQKSPVQTKRTSVRYTVNGLPSAQFEGDQHVQLCENSLVKSTEPVVTIPVTFEGEYPFRLRGVLTHEPSGRVERIVLDDIRETSVPLYADYDLMTVGEHVFRIEELEDGNGCKRLEFDPTDAYVVEVTPAPNVERSSAKTHFCVGDHVAYNLTGQPPFSIMYEFNERRQTAPNLHEFVRLASRPGVLTVQGIADDRCRVDFEPARSLELALYVHDLPSVEVNKGDNIIEDIHEGDQVELTFTFSGVPPFELTYVRTTEAIHGKKREIVEQHTVKDIWDHEYSTLASLEGTYEAIVVKDAFCVARRKI